ncbi:hypothetical protein DH2020_049798 [Rehmannia glutinosa]|uniref:Uncharacterized protein n=1 Tax=Rehmannia glutinosa TaxID=99300 RepID=A0ABR0U2C9_REHGL
MEQRKIKEHKNHILGRDGNMKRQRGNSRKGAKTDTVVAKKKTKVAPGDVKAKEVAEERKTAAETAEEEVAEWASLWSGVDEEMSWATSWIPFWEMDAYDALYGDVLWDFDIWDLKSTGIAQNP